MSGDVSGYHIRGGEHLWFPVNRGQECCRTPRHPQGPSPNNQESSGPEWQSSQDWEVSLSLGFQSKCGVIVKHLSPQMLLELQVGVAEQRQNSSLRPHYSVILIQEEHWTSGACSTKWANQRQIRRGGWPQERHNPERGRGKSSRTGVHIIMIQRRWKRQGHRS